MELWLAALVFIIVAIGAVVLLLHSRKKQKKHLLIVGICVLGAVLLILAAYIALTFLFLDKISSEAPPSDGLEAGRGEILSKI
jgi:RsiW-degrading membrane proteinase PrsW (M82 family)